MKSGWIEKYYYILKVIRSCESSNNIQTTIKARRWGLDILRKEYDVICKTPKAKKVQAELYDISSQIFDKVVDNIKNFNADEHSTL